MVDDQPYVLDKDRVLPKTENLLQWRIDHLRSEAAKAQTEADFKRGYASGMQRALEYIYGVDILGRSIDPAKLPKGWK